MSLTKAEKSKTEEEEKYRTQVRGRLSKPFETKTRRSRTIAALLAFIFSDLGIHKFYLGQPGLGILYLLFAWTGIPFIISLVEGIIYLSMSDQAFQARYS